MRVIKDDKNAMGTNSYLLILDNKDCYIIDASSNLDSFKTIIKDDNLNLKAILLTHAHFDHIMGLKNLKEYFNVDVVCHIKEKNVLNNQNINLSSMIGSKMEFEADVYLDSEEGTYDSIRYFLTPGHTSGGVCYFIGEHLFTGDTLFAGSIGRTDFPGGDYNTLINVIKEKLFVLDPDTIIYPGHGPESKIGYEINNNPFLI